MQVSNTVQRHPAVTAHRTALTALTPPATVASSAAYALGLREYQQQQQLGSRTFQWCSCSFYQSRQRRQRRAQGEASSPLHGSEVVSSLLLRRGDQPGVTAICRMLLALRKTCWLLTPARPLVASQQVSLNALTLVRSHRGGKSSIRKVVFERMAPNDTLFIEKTAKSTADDIKFASPPRSPSPDVC